MLTFRVAHAVVLAVALALEVMARSVAAEETFGDSLEWMVADSAPTSFVVNGGFEQRHLGEPPNYIESLSPMSAELAGWEVIAGNVDWIGPLRWRSAAGQCCLDLDAPGAIRQTLATAPGEVYVLTFDLAGNVETEPAVKNLAVEVGGNKHTFTFDMTGHTSDDLGWIKKRIVFRAETEKTTLTFWNASEELTASGVALDNISVTVALSDPPDGKVTDGRYRLATVGERLVLLDSAAGQTWVLTECDQGPIWMPIERVDAVDGTRRADADQIAAPRVRIVAGEPTTIPDSSFVSFSCEATNSNKVPLLFVGYRRDSFAPPLTEGQISPIYVIQLQRDGEWQEHPVGWCGTGIDAIALPADCAGTFGFAVPVDPRWDAVRVGIRWSRRLDASVDEQDSFAIAWSEPLRLDKIGEVQDE